MGWGLLSAGKKEKKWGAELLIFSRKRGIKWSWARGSGWLSPPLIFKIPQNIVWASNLIPQLSFFFLNLIFFNFFYF